MARRVVRLSFPPRHGRFFRADRPRMARAHMVPQGHACRRACRGRRRRSGIPPFRAVGDWPGVIGCPATVRSCQLRNARTPRSKNFNTEEDRGPQRATEGHGAEKQCASREALSNRVAPDPSPKKRMVASATGGLGSPVPPLVRDRPAPRRRHLAASTPGKTIQANSPARSLVSVALCGPRPSSVLRSGPGARHGHDNPPRTPAPGQQETSGASEAHAPGRNTAPPPGGDTLR